MITFEQFNNEIKTALKDKPSWSRDGQFVFNYIDKYYHVAREIQFIDGIDCFYNDNIIDEFILAAFNKLKNKI